LNFKRLTLFAAASSLIAALLLLVFDMAEWFYAQSFVVLFDARSISGLVLSFYVEEFLAIVLVVVSALYLLWNINGMKGSDPDNTTRAMIFRSLRSGRSLKFGVLLGAVYGLIYSFASSILVYQPSVDFLQAYGVTGPGWSAITCCGSFGTIPKLILFVSPQLHFAVQLVPLSALFLVIVPFLVAFNFTIMSYAVAAGSMRRTGWLSVLGASVGLFTACPTCAGLFLAGAVGGIGATSLAITLAPYQTLFIIVSIPLLLLSPTLVAATMRRYLDSSCDIR
jgi:hypothetical protein